MSDQIVRFSRLLRILKVNERPAFIIELEKNNQKNLYISFFTKKGFHCFESYKKTELKNKFKNLSKKCLMSQCKDATGMFQKSIITHFEADCSSLIYGHSMFSISSIRSIKTEFPQLEDGDFMFFKTKIKEININFPKLKSGSFMFSHSPLEKITSQFPKLKNKDHLFEGVPPELKLNCPYYFV